MNSKNTFQALQKRRPKTIKEIEFGMITCSRELHRAWRAYHRIVRGQSDVWPIRTAIDTMAKQIPQITMALGRLIAIDESLALLAISEQDYVQHAYRELQKSEEALEDMREILAYRLRWRNSGTKQEQ